MFRGILLLCEGFSFNLVVIFPLSRLLLSRWKWKSSGRRNPREAGEASQGARQVFYLPGRNHEFELPVIWQNFLKRLVKFNMVGTMGFCSRANSEFRQNLVCIPYVLVFLVILLDFFYYIFMWRLLRYSIITFCCSN